MAKYDKLLEYIPFFEKEEDAYIVENLNGSPIYSAKFMSFIREIENTDLPDVNYPLVASYDAIQALTEKILTLDFNTLRAVLTYYYRQERFCWGLWGYAASNGIFLKILLRLKELAAEIEA